VLFAGRFTTGYSYLSPSGLEILSSSSAFGGEAGRGPMASEIQDSDT